MASLTAPILITGATGVVGLAVVDRLLQEGYPLRALVRDPATAKGLLPASVELIEGSLEDVVGLQEALRGCEACIHIAGLVEFGDKHRDLLLKTNHGGTANVVNACLGEPGLKHLIHFGSVAAIPMAAGDEKTVPRPRQYSSYYGFTKRLSEMEVERGGAEGLGFTILRPSVVLGRHPKLRSSSAVLRVAARPTTVCPPGDLHWVAVADVAEAVAKALGHTPEGKTYVLDAEPTLWRNFFTEYRRQAGTIGTVYSVPKGMVSVVGRLSPLLSGLLGLPIPGRRQLLNMLVPHEYPGRGEAEELLGRPFTGLAEAVRALV